MTPILEIRDLVYRRGKFTLRVERLDLQEGGRYLLTGPNGAGKSTLLQLLAQLEVPASGSLQFRGRKVLTARDRQKVRRQVTLVEQSPFLFEGTVYQNLAFGLRLRDVRGGFQRRRIGKALETVGLEGFEEHRSDSLSGGEIQRVALARALVLRPKLLLLDEASSGLDAEVRPVFERLVRQLSDKGVTVVLSSHDHDQPQRLDARLLTMEHGILRQQNHHPIQTETERQSCPIPLPMHGN